MPSARLVDSKLNALHTRVLFIYIIHPNEDLLGNKNDDYWKVCPLVNLGDNSTRQDLFEQIVPKLIPLLSEVFTEDLGSALQVCLSFDFDSSILSANRTIECFQEILKGENFV
jgi:hypothetical protein